MHRKLPYQHFAFSRRSLGVGGQRYRRWKRSWYLHILTSQIFTWLLPILAIVLAVDVFIHGFQGSLSYETKRLNEARSIAQHTLEQSRLAGLPASSLRVALAAPAPDWPQIIALLLMGNSANVPWEQQRALLLHESASLQPALHQWQQEMRVITRERTAVVNLLRQLGAELPQLSPVIRQREVALSLYGAVPLQQAVATMQRLQRTEGWAQRYLSITKRDQAVIARARWLIQQGEQLGTSTTSFAEAVNRAQQTLTTATSLHSLQSLALELQKAIPPEQRAVTVAADIKLKHARQTAIALYHRLQPSLLAAAQQIAQQLTHPPLLPQQSEITTDEELATQLNNLDQHMQNLLRAEQQLHVTFEHAQLLGQQAARLGLPTGNLEEAITSARLRRRRTTTAATIHAINNQLQSVIATFAPTVQQAAQDQLEHDRQQSISLLQQLQEHMPQLTTIIQQHLVKLVLKGHVSLDQEQADHTAFRATVSWATSLITAHQSAEAELHQAQLLLKKATQLHVALGNVPQEIAIFRQATAKATSARALTQATTALKNATRLLRIQVLAAGPGPGKVLVVHLRQQSLTAYDNGKSVLTTPVTTGRKHLRTPIGIDTITWHASPYLFISPWPRTSPFWYPRSWVTWVMHFHSGGYFIHDAPWEPSSAFGPGSENGPYSSHGCIQVPHAAMQFLYSWTPNGTTVIVAP